jgi:arylsulfotransferase ASST
LNTRHTRREFLKAAGVGAAWVALGTTLGCEPDRRASATASPTRVGQAWSFRSRPDLSPPAVKVTTRTHDTAPGYLFVGPKRVGTGQDGPMILDNRGQPVWFRSFQGTDLHALDFKAQTYRGRPVITWVTWNEGEYVILDDSYREITRIRAGNGYRGDHHEFLITSGDTALITIYNPVPGDLSPVGGPKDGVVVQGICQELDIETGEVLFEWHSLDHVGLEETYAEPSNGPSPSIDYFHINSIDVDHDGNLIVSARNTSAVYKIDRQTGEIIWRLGGKESDFEIGQGTRFAYQHDARRQPDGTITIFDNGTTIFEDGVPKAVEESRGIELELDEEEMTASLVREYTHPDKQFAHAGGNMQVLPNGNVLIGWGRAPAFSEFGKDGRLLFSASFPSDFAPTDASYRAFRFPWSGRPDDDPAVAAEIGPDDEITLYASWNGATEVATWEVLAGPGPDRLEALASVPRKGFETAIKVKTAEPRVGVRAKDASGEILGASKAIKPRG